VSLLLFSTLHDVRHLVGCRPDFVESTVLHRVAEHAEACVENDQADRSGNDPRPRARRTELFERGMSEEAGAESDPEQPERSQALPGAVVANGSLGIRSGGIPLNR